MSGSGGNVELDRSIVESVNKANKKIGEFFYLLANEPSVGLYHVQEHIRKTIPKNTEVKKDIRKKYQTIEAMTYDVNFSIQTVKSLHDLTTFSTIKQTMDSCIEITNALTKGVPIKRTAPSTPSRPGAAPSLPTTPSIPSLSIPATPTSQAPSEVTPQALLTPKPDTPYHNSGEVTDDTAVTDNNNNNNGEGGSGSGSNSSNSITETNNNLTESDSTEIGDEGLSPATAKKVKKTKKPKAAKSLSKNFDLTPKQF